MTRTTTGGHPDMKLVNPGAAAVDIGSTIHMAAVNPDICDAPVRLRHLHAGSARACGVVPVVRSDQRRDGIDRRPLDTGL
jgi:hypothetical protein